MDSVFIDGSSGEGGGQILRTSLTLACITGKAVRAVALGIGFVLSAVAYGLAEGLIPPAAEPYIEWAFASVVGGLGGMGLWHLGKRFLSTNAISDGDLADAVAHGLQALEFLPPGDHSFHIVGDENGSLRLAEPGELSVTATGPGFEIVDDG